MKVLISAGEELEARWYQSDVIGWNQAFRGTDDLKYSSTLRHEERCREWSARKRRRRSRRMRSRWWKIREGGGGGQGGVEEGNGGGEREEQKGKEEEKRNRSR